MNFVQPLYAKAQQASKIHTRSALTYKVPILFRIDYIKVFMIINFKCKYTQTLFSTGKTKRWSAIKNVIERKLLQLDNATTLDDLKSPPGNCLEALLRDREGQHSIRINAQWRLCFIWREQGATDVEIVDYH